MVFFFFQVNTRHGSSSSRGSSPAESLSNNRWVSLCGLKTLHVPSPSLICVTCSRSFICLFLLLERSNEELQTLYTWSGLNWTQAQIKTSESATTCTNELSLNTFISPILTTPKRAVFTPSLSKLVCFPTAVCLTQLSSQLSASLQDDTGAGNPILIKKNIDLD